MHYVPLGFRGPPGAPTETASGVPIVSYTSTSGWAARPILATGYYRPTIVAPEPSAPVYNGGSNIPFYDTGKTFTYTREQIQEMIDRSRARDQELTSGQYDEGGDGYDNDLDAEAAAENARQKAADDAGLPDAKFPEQKTLVPLGIAAALAYFFLM